MIDPVEAARKAGEHAGRNIDFGTETNAAVLGAAITAAVQDGAAELRRHGIAENCIGAWEEGCDRLGRTRIQLIAEIGGGRDR
jgi:hypothetical protein